MQRSRAPPCSGPPLQLQGVRGGDAGEGALRGERCVMAPQAAALGDTFRTEDSFFDAAGGEGASPSGSPGRRGELYRSIHPGTYDPRADITKRLNAATLGVKEKHGHATFGAFCAGGAAPTRLGSCTARGRGWTPQRARRVPGVANGEHPCARVQAGRWARSSPTR